MRLRDRLRVCFNRNDRRPNHQPGARGAQDRVGAEAGWPAQGIVAHQSSGDRHAGSDAEQTTKEIRVKNNEELRMNEFSLMLVRSQIYIQD